MVSTSLYSHLKVGVTIYGDGRQTRSFGYVDNLIDTMVQMINSPADFIEPVNTGNPNEFAIIDLAEKIIKLTISLSKIIFKSLPLDDPKQCQPDIKLA